MLNFKILLLFLIPLNVQSYLKRTRSQPKSTKLEIRAHHDKDFTNRVIIPNESFCKKMSLRGPDYYMVMPWWYHYCENLSDKAKKGMNENDIERLRLLKPYQNVLDKVARFRKRQKLRQHIENNLELN